MIMKYVRLTGDNEDENFNIHAVYDNFETDAEMFFINKSPSKKGM